MEDLCYTYKLKLNVTTQQSTEFEEGTVLLDQPYYNSPDCSEIYDHGETDTSEPPQLAVMHYGIPIEGTVFVGGKGNTLELDLERSAETTKSATVKLVDVATGETLQELKSASNDYGSALEFVDVQLDKAFPSGEYDLIVTWDGAESISRITLLNPEDAVDAGTAEAAIEGGNEVSFLDAGDIVPFENLIENDVITLQAENEYGAVSFYVPLKDNVEDYLLVLSGKTLQGQDFVKIESLYDWDDGGVATFHIANTVGEFGPYTLKLMGNGKTYTWQIKVQVDQDVAEEYDFRSGVAYNTCAFCVVSKPMQTIQIVFGDAVVGTRVFYGAAGYDLPISIEAYDSETDLLVELINAEGVVVASNTIPQKVLEYDRIEYPITLPEGITSGEYVLSISNGDCTITRKLNLRCDETVIPFNCYGTPDTDRSLNPIKYGLVPEWLSY